MPTSASCYGRTIPPRSPLFLSAAAHGHFSLAKINSSKPKLTPLQSSSHLYFSYFLPGSSGLLLLFVELITSLFTPSAPTPTRNGRLRSASQTPENKPIKTRPPAPLPML